MLCTHEHADHFDPASIQPILAASPRAVLVIPQWIAGDALRAGVETNRLRTTRGEGDSISLPEGVQITAFPAAHYELEYDSEHGHRWQGFLIELAGIRIYHSGDTINYPYLVPQLRALNLDILIVPVNGRDAARDQQGIVGNLWPDEAVKLTAAVGAQLVIPCHWDMFAVNSLPPGDFANAIATTHPYQPFKIMAQAERFVYTR